MAKRAQTAPALEPAEIAPRPEKVFTETRRCMFTVCISRRRGWISKSSLLPPGTLKRGRRELTESDQRDPQIVAMQRRMLAEGE